MISKFNRIAAALAMTAALVAPAFGQEVVKIGFSGPLSGGAALYGKNVLDGMKMAADEINATGFEVAGRSTRSRSSRSTTSTTRARPRSTRSASYKRARRPRSWCRTPAASTRCRPTTSRRST